MIVDGKLIAANLNQRISEKLLGLKKRICFIIFGSDPGSLKFISIKSKIAESLGISVKVLEYPEDTSFHDAVIEVTEAVNSGFHGIVIQLPLPAHFQTEDILNLLPVEQDIDLLSDKAKQQYKNKTSKKIPPVARAILEILDFYKVDLEGKEILVIGRGKLVGKPVCSMLELKGLPFKVIDKDTDQDTQTKLISSADIIISGAGSPYLIKPGMVKDGVVLIDAGTSEQNGKFVGDIDPACAEKASLLTPVPNGLGPVVVSSLLLNLI